MGQQSFHKEERLKKEKLIKELFEKGSYFNFYPIRVVHLANTTESKYHQALFTVSSRNFKKAVDRNRLKRRMREAYRMRKSQLKEDPKLLLGFIYAGKSESKFVEIDKAMGLAIGKLNAVLESLRDGH